MKTKFCRAGALLAALVLLAAALTGAAAANTSVQDTRGGVARVYVKYSDDSYVYTQTGSGFFIGEAGKPVEYMITNAHVITATDIDGNVLGYLDEVQVIFDTLGAVSTTDAKVVKYFTDYDLAILRLNAPTTLRTPLPLRPAGEIQVTDTVYAVGFPSVADDSNDYKSTVDDVTINKGSITKEEYLYEGVSFLQMDVAINPGNSGGPLVDENGSVIGINTMGVSGASTNYALYIDYAINYLDTMGIPYTQAGAVPAMNADQTQEPAGDGTAEPTAAAPDASQAQEGTGGAAWWMIAVPAAVVVAAVAVVAVVLGKKKQEDASRRMEPSIPVQPMPAPQPAPRPQNQGRQLVSIGAANSLGGKAYTISGTMTVGRDPARCQIVFPPKTPGVSGVHCTVQPTPDGILLTDEGSSYGTFLDNGAKLNVNTPYNLRVGETFYLASKDNGFRVK